MATEPTPGSAPTLRAGPPRPRCSPRWRPHDLDVLVLGRVANIRYVSGVPILWNAGTRPFGPGCVVVRATGEVYLLSTWDEGVPDDIPHDHLYGITWNPMNFVDAAAGHRGRRPARAGRHRRHVAAVRPAAADGLPRRRDRRRRAAPCARRGASRRAEEVDAIRAAIGVAERRMAAAVAELRPGVSERELTGVFMDAMASQRRHHAGDPGRRPHHLGRRLGRARPATGASSAGDLVSFDAGVVADGYVGEVGRTWPVGPRRRRAGASSDLYRRSDELWERLLDACRPGAAGQRPARRVPTRPASRCPSTPVARGLGLGFDDPVVARDLPDDRGGRARSTRASSSSSPAASFDDTRRLGRRARAGPHHRRRARGAVAQPVLEPRARRSPRHDRRPTVRPRGRLHPLREGSGDEDRHDHAQPARPAQRADDRHAAAATPTCSTRPTSTTT